MKQMGRGFREGRAVKPIPEDVKMCSKMPGLEAGSGDHLRRVDLDVDLGREKTYAISYECFDPNKVLDALKKKPEWST
jgi:hypothetical protein